MTTEIAALIISNAVVAITIAVRLERRLGALSERIARVEVLVEGERA